MKALILEYIRLDISWHKHHYGHQFINKFNHSEVSLVIIDRNNFDL